MHNIVNNITTITKELSAINSNTKIIAVSKTFTMSYIKPLVDHGHIDFGENKVQEAISKWTEIKEKNQNIKLHLIGKLQTNKVKFCLPLFDYIHSLDSIKLADKIANEQTKKNFKPKIFIQVNVGDEDQKSGVTVKDFESFYKKITEDFDLNIIGLMCIPPFVDDTKKYFEKMIELKSKTNLNELSMGMSNDYVEAAKCSSTYVRVGSKIFGARS
tara:strand:+ start:939 stop:1583 length:645 start_codon:yes stop_codon:yes gene_type:complete